ncbi:MAG: Maf family protein [Acidimicrobiales bacterium]|uniref:Maf family protein n=1 Tax=uncultured Ilumatobacter sp. TaxID=879968 RepID=UPI00374FCCBB
MFDLAAPLVLASGSPRRRELLSGAGLRFSVRPADIDETPLAGEAPGNYVRRLSIEKAAASMGSPLASPAEIVLAADTTVDVKGEILEKPLDADDAYRMLRMLSGRTHLVHTGVTVSVPITGARRSSTIVVATEVTFGDLEDAAIDWYLETGEAMDKAGAYGIQGAAGAFVEKINGSVTNVIGLPLAETLTLLRDATSA